MAKEFSFEEALGAPKQSTEFSFAEALGAPKASTERTWGESFKDIGAGAVSGVGSLVQLPGQLYGLATGDFSKTGALGLGEAIEKYGDEMKSVGLKEREARRSEAVKKAEETGQWEAFKTAIGQTVTDPALFFSFLSEQAPQLIPAIVTGGGTAALTSAGVMGKAAARGISKEAAEKVAQKAAIKSGANAAIQTGAVQQGADIGAGSYDEIYKNAISQGKSPEQAGREAINLARAAGVTGYALSVLANKYLPGAGAMERAFAGERTGAGRLAGVGIGALKEIPGENIEEVGGKIAQNIAARQAGMDRDLMAGTGETAAMATVGAGGMGGVTGLIGGGKSDEQIRTEQKALVDQINKIKEEEKTITPPAVEPEKEVASYESLYGDEAKAKESKAAVPANVAAMQAEYDKRDQEIKEMEARGVTLTGTERGLLTGKRNKNRKLQARINDALTQVPPTGETNVAGADEQTGRASTAVPPQSTDVVSTAARVGETERTGVVSTGQNVTTPSAGEAAKPATVAPLDEANVLATTTVSVGDKKQTKKTYKDGSVTIDGVLYPPPATAPTAPTTPTTAPAPTTLTAPTTATTRKTELDKDDDFLNSLLGDDGLPSRGTAAVSPEQAKVDAKVDNLAADYGLERGAGESTVALAKRIKTLVADRRKAEEEFVRRTTIEGEPLSAIESATIAKQSLVGTKPITVPQQQIDMYEEMREGFNQETETNNEKLPAFENLTPDEKRVYFQENIARNSWDEHEVAAAKLSSYIESKRSDAEAAGRQATKAGEDKKPAREQAQAEVRGRESYQREKPSFSRKTGIAYEFPDWNYLSDESRKLYTDINKTDTVLEQDMAFRAIKAQVIKEQAAERSRISAAESEARATQEMLAAAERARKSQPAGKGQILPLNILKKLGRGDIKAVLEYLAAQGEGLKPKIGYEMRRVKTKSGKFVLRRKLVDIRDLVALNIFRNLANVLGNVEGLKVNVVFDKNMIYDQIAKYDAKTNTLYVGPKGLDEATILHELTHAATVKIIHQYFTDKSKLDPRAVQAVERMLDIASAAKAKLNNEFPNAFENLYEFVAYAMTDIKFQNALAQIQIPRLAKATEKTSEQSKELQLERETGVREANYDSMFDNLWDYFSGTLAFMYKLFRPERTSTAYLLPTEKTGTTGRTEGKSIAPNERKTLRAPSLADKEALNPSELFDNPEELQKAEIPNEIGAEPGELVNARGVTNLKREILREPGYKGNLLLEAAAAFQDILAAPEGGIERLAGKETVATDESVLSSKGTATGPQTKKEKERTGKRTPEEIVKAQMPPEKTTLGALSKHFMTKRGRDSLVKKFVNSRIAIKKWENALTNAGKIVFDGSKINSIYTSIMTSSGIAKDLFLQRVNAPQLALQNAVADYAAKRGVTTDEALAELHSILMARHESERRHIKYLMNVPLSNTKTQIKLADGRTITTSPAQLRRDIFTALTAKKLDKATIDKLRADMENLVKNHKDINGVSGVKEGDALYKSLDENNTLFDVTGNTREEIEGVTKKYDTPAVAKEVDAAYKAMQQLFEATKSLNKEANYWSDPVQNFVDFYGWKSYIPLKGRFKDDTGNNGFLDFNGTRLGSELQESQGGFEGRESPADNALVEAMSDATRAALRAGRKDLTLAIKNAAIDGLVDSKPFTGPDGKKQKFERISFEDRYKYGVEKGQNKIFHYNSDGSIDVIELQNADQLRAIKRTYAESMPLIDMLNQVTSFFGSMHTRYNPSFGPVNFVRDMLTNSFNIAADMGPKAASQYVAAVAEQVVNGGLYRAWKVAGLYESGKFDEIKNLAKTDPFIKDMYDYIEKGGKVSYLQGISSKGKLQELRKDMTRNKFLKGKEKIDGFMDIWTDMFELASRTAAYRISKSKYMAEDMSEAEASKRAVGYTKDLANFEQVGEWGRAAGAMFMFFRPAATGAYRAIESLAPAFQSLESAKANLPTKVLEDKEAMAKFEKEYAERKKTARALMGALTAMGMIVYMMAAAMSDDDEMGRNKIATDDMDRWSRYARFFIPGMENAIQIPWGFGIGSFAAVGAQLAAAAGGNSSISNALKNSFLIGMDSFLPIPVSRINPIEQPAAWVMDSMLPSAVRPLLEWTMNVDGLGREIYNNRQSRFGDAYTGGDNIPEIYKSAARMLYNATEGGADVSPNTLYFFANNYMDGAFRVIQGLSNLGMAAMNEKDFNPKTDTILFDSFFGTPSNVDAREYSAVEKQIADINKRLTTLKANSPELYANYLEKNPMHSFAVDIFNKQANGVLRDLRQQANVYRRMPELSPKERNEMVKNTVKMENLVKRNILNMMEAYEIKP